MEELVNDIISTSQKLLQTAHDQWPDLSGLKKLKDETLIPYLYRADSDKKRFVLFFLVNFLNDVFYNLIGDFPYEDSFGKVVHERKKEFFLVVGRKLSGVGKALSTENFNKIYELFESLVTSYIVAIDEINSLIETKMK